MSFDKIATFSSVSTCVLNESLVVPCSNCTATSLSGYPLSLKNVTISLFTAVSSSVPAIVIFTHQVNSSENLALEKKKNSATINTTTPILTRVYDLLIIENGAFIDTSII